MAKTLKERVEQAWHVAVDENLTDFVGWTPRQIAEDMASYDSGLENESVDEIASILEEMGEE